MPLPILIASAEDVKSFQPCVTVISGPPGSGKTTAAATWPRPLAFDFERGMKYIMVQDENGERTPIPRIQLPLEIMTAPRNRMESILNWLVDCLKELADQQTSQFSTLIFDTLDELWRQISEAFMFDKGLKALEPRDHYIPIYNQLLPFMQTVFQMEAWGYHVVLVCHTADKEPESGTLPVHRLTIPGKVSEMVQNLPDEMFWLAPDFPSKEAMKEAEDKGFEIEQQPNRFLCQFSHRHPSKDRSGLLPRFTPATFQAVDAAFRGEDPTQPQYQPQIGVVQGKRMRTKGAALGLGRKKSR